MAGVTLAEEMNFTRAADRLKITQPALSKQIAELESRVGFVIFKRDQRRVELTEAGQVLIVGLQDSMAILEKAIRLASQARTASPCARGNSASGSDRPAIIRFT
jgi:DNA-binding transcriptional LysR family regulator